MNIELWSSALILASLYILLALAFTITWSTNKTPNYSIGPIMSLGAYQSYTLARLLNQPVYLSIPLALIVGFIVNTGLYLTVIKPLVKRQRSPVMITLASLALSLVLTGLVQIYADWINEFYNLYGYVFLLKQQDFSVGSAPGVFYVASLSAFSAYFLWRRFYYKTATGLRYRVLLENPELAMVQGVNPETVWTLLWGVSGSLACLAGALCPIWFSFSFTSGTQVINAIIAVSLLGGLMGRRGFFLSGLVSGVVEIMGTICAQIRWGTWIGEYRPFIPITILVLTLLVIQNKKRNYSSYTSQPIAWFDK